MDAVFHVLLACIRYRAKDDNFTAAQLLDALLEIIAVEEGLVFEAVPYVLKQVSVEAVFFSRGGQGRVPSKNSGVRMCSA